LTEAIGKLQQCSNELQAFSRICGNTKAMLLSAMPVWHRIEVAREFANVAKAVRGASVATAVCSCSGETKAMAVTCVPASSHESD
jgi:hypothetical protein